MAKTILYIGNKLSSSNINPTTHRALESHLTAEGFNVISASPFKNKVLRLAHMKLVFFQNIRKVDYVIIDVYSTQNFWYAVIMGWISHLFSIKYIPILHGGDLKKRFQNTPKSSRALLKGAYNIISPSLYFKSVVEKLGYTNVTYIPNSLELENYIYKDREIFRPRLLWVRAFDKIYNPLLALKTLRLLLNTYPDAKMVMVGPDKDGSFSRAEMYSQKYSLPVKFTGKLEKAEWLELSKDYDIFINSSTIDNSPVSVIEAMALGLPVVSTNVGGMPYLIKDGYTGMLVNPNDPQEMTSKIISLLATPTKARILAQNAKEKTKEFDWDIIRGEWLKILT